MLILKQILRNTKIKKSKEITETLPYQKTNFLF